MKLTKATVKRINAHSDINKSDYCPAINIIGKILNRSSVLLGEPGYYEINDDSSELVQPVIFSDGKREFVSGRTSNEYEKKIVRGLASKYPSWISGTFTLGLNGVDIYDVNKLVKAILES